MTGAGAGGDGGEVPSAVCGDGELQGDEACDDGEDNGKNGQCDASCAFSCEGACPLRVDPELAEDGDGRSWATALRSLQAAVDQQWEAGGGEVWVKAAAVVAGDTNPVLTLRSGVDVYGGFAGTELARSERATPSVDSATPLDAATKAYPAVVGSGGVILDGFVIRNAEGESGPALTAKSITELTLRHVFFTDNHSTGCGGAMLLDGATVTIEGGAFDDNHSDSTGGAVCVVRATVLEVFGTKFVGNTALVRGGAIDAQGSYSPAAMPELSLIRATFVGNHATREDPPSAGGGALYQVAGWLTVRDSDFKANGAAVQTGAALFVSDVSSEIRNSTFAEQAGFHAAVYGEVGSTSIVGSTFYFNDLNCPGQCDVAGSGVVLQNSAIVIKSKLSTPGIGANVTQTNNCTIFTEGGLGQLPSPFGSPAPDRDGNGVGDYLLVQPADNPCLGAGDDATSTNAGIEWSALTTSGNNCLDVSPVDAGRHYTPSTANPMPCE